jgi:hypothetical protein
VDGVAQVTAVSFSGRQEQFSLFDAGGVHAPFLDAGDEHRGMEGLDFLSLARVAMVVP